MKTLRYKLTIDKSEFNTMCETIGTDRIDEVITRRIVGPIIENIISDRDNFEVKVCDNPNSFQWESVVKILTKQDKKDLISLKSLMKTLDLLDYERNGTDYTRTLQILNDVVNKFLTEEQLVEAKQ